MGWWGYAKRNEFLIRSITPPTCTEWVQHMGQERPKGRMKAQEVFRGARQERIQVHMRLHDIYHMTMTHAQTTGLDADAIDVLAPAVELTFPQATAATADMQATLSLLSEPRLGG
eukprot:2619192-Pyramimonas_sp.AAC.1